VKQPGFPARLEKFSPALSRREKFFTTGETMVRVMVTALPDEEKIKYARLLAEYIVVKEVELYSLMKVTGEIPETCTKGSENACVNWLARNDPGMYEGLRVGNAHYLWKELEEPSLVPTALRTPQTHDENLSSHREEYQT
jgi:hypothetical protein